MNILPFINRDQLEGSRVLQELVNHYQNQFNGKCIPNRFDEGKTNWYWGEFRWHGIGRFIKAEFSATDRGLSEESINLDSLLNPETKAQLQAIVLHSILLGRITSRASAQRLLSPLLCLEYVMRVRSKNGVANFHELKVTDLNAASEWSSSRTDTVAPIQIARDVLIDLGIVKSGAVKTWVNSIEKKRINEKDWIYRTEQSSDDIANKLPNIVAVKANADYFREQPWITKGDDLTAFDKDERNTLVSSVITLASLMPFRLSESLDFMTVDCLVEMPKDGVKALGVYWYASKTNMDQIKWVPKTSDNVFETVVREAIARIKFVTEPARKLLRTWDERCPEFDKSAYDLANSKGWLPFNFPYASEKLNLRYSDKLFITLKYQTASTRKTLPNQIETIKYAKWIDWLRFKHSKSRHSGKHTYQPSFFERISDEIYDLELDDFNSHAYRHMVNTACWLGGLSEWEINWWSHRKKIGQGRIYNHTSHEQQMNLVVHGAYKEAELSPKQRLDAINNNLSVTRKNLGLSFELIPHGNGGFTFNHPLGTCSHNYSLGPCLKDMNCIECDENIYCKGDKRTLKNLMEEFHFVNQNLLEAQKSGDFLGITRFERRFSILDALIKTLGENSPLVDGDLVALSREQLTKSGLIERAKLVAKKIRSNQLEVEITHKKDMDALDLTERSLSHTSERSTESEFLDSLQNRFMIDLESDEN